jgi:hypothetical protein
MGRSEDGSRQVTREGAKSEDSKAPQASNAAKDQPCWPFPAGSQNDTDKAVKLKPYVPPKRRTLNQY